MGECEPVGAISKKWIGRVCNAKSVIDAFNPLKQPGDFGKRSQPSRMQNGHEAAQLCFEREGRDATEDQADDEDGEPEVNASKMIGLRHEYEQSR